MSQAWDSQALAGVYARMVRAGARFIVVGGQAVNLWAENYRQSPDPGVDWESMAPFTSRDLDCLGGSVDALAVGRDFQVRAQVYDPFGKAWAPSVADVQVPVEVEGEVHTLLVQFLHTVKGLNSNEVEASARELEAIGTRAGGTAGAFCGYRATERVRNGIDLVGKRTTRRASHQVHQGKATASMRRRRRGKHIAKEA